MAITLQPMRIIVLRSTFGAPDPEKWAWRMTEAMLQGLTNPKSELTSFVTNRNSQYADFLAPLGNNKPRPREFGVIVANTSYNELHMLGESFVKLADQYPAFDAWAKVGVMRLLDWQQAYSIQSSDEPRPFSIAALGSRTPLSRALVMPLRNEYPANEIEVLRGFIAAARPLDPDATVSAPHVRLDDGRRDSVRELREVRPPSVVTTQRVTGASPIQPPSLPKAPADQCGQFRVPKVWPR